MGTLGMQETIFIFLLALIIFGPKKLPELGKNIAKGIAEFRRHSNDLKATFDKEMATIERETAEVSQDLTKYSNEINYDSSYDSNYYDSGNDGYNGGTGETSAETSSVSASATQGAESSTATDNGSDGATLPAHAEENVTSDYAAVGDSAQPSAATETAVAHAEPEPTPVART